MMQDGGSGWVDVTTLALIYFGPPRCAVALIRIWQVCQQQSLARQERGMEAALP